MTRGEALAAIISALATVPDEHLPLLLRLIALGSRAELRAELRARVDIETLGTRHALTPTPRDTWIKVLVLGAWDALAGDGKGRR